MPRRLPARDPTTGRFSKAPKPKPLDPELVASLGQGRRALCYFLDCCWRLQVHSMTRYTVTEKPEETDDA